MPDEPPLDKLANHVPPRRAAARKASKLAAEQLESSPIPSDAENDGGASFGEPSTPRSAVKVTYGSKRKYKQSPATPRSPTRQAGPSKVRTRSQSLREDSPRKPKNGAGRGRGASRGRGTRKVQKTRARSVSSVSQASDGSSGHSSDLEFIGNAPKAPAARRAAAAAPTKPVSKAGPSNGHAASAKGSKKRPLSLSSSSGSEGSLLTPLPSPEVQKSPVTRPMPVLAPRLARQFMRTQSHADATLGSAKKNALKQAKSFDHIFMLDSSTDEESFEDDHDIGSLVWVSIDLEGNLVDCDEENSDTLWWPAKVYLPRPYMRVALFGEPPGHTDSGAQHLTIPNPSPSNVRSMLHNGKMRFSDTDYRPSRRESAQSSPRKKRKLDIDAAWRDARDLMVRADRGETSAHPSARSKGRPSSTNGKRTLNPFPSLDTRTSKGKGKARARRKDSESDASLSDLDEDDESFKPEKLGQTWRAPSADPFLEIPGELVLAKEGRARTQYWPAKLLEYLKPKSANQRPKYRALFFDGTVLPIEPDWFWTTTEEEFGTCKLGQSTGNYGLDSDVDDADDDDPPEDFNRPFASEDEAELRAPSPLPSLPPPAPEVFEYDLSIAEQFDYVKPVLAAVLEGTYAPAQPYHEGFMRGAGARQKVLNSVPLCGSLSARDKEEVAYLVRSWARRRERRREMGLSVDYPPEKLYPPDGGTDGAAARRAADEANGQGDDDWDAESVLTPASDASDGDTEPLALEAGPPSSSFAATEGDTDDDEQARIAAQDGAAREDAVSGRAQPSLASGALGGDDLQHAVTAEAASANLPSEDPTVPPHVGTGDATAATAGTEDQVQAVQEVDLPRAPPRTTFHDLDAVEKITYCNNVLLQEAVLQLLLWRTGQRKALGLLSPEEEQRLHDIALEEGEKTNWVHDIIRLRQAAEQSMLPTDKGKSKGKEKAPPGPRARTRRGA